MVLAETAVLQKLGINPPQIKQVKGVHKKSGHRRHKRAKALA
jgi:hypothetical protein